MSVDGSVRPANRRELIIDAATELFARRGYEAVSMSDIAAVVDVQPSALYRHFSNKENLLDVIIDRALGGLESVFALPDMPTDVGLYRLAEYAIDHRYVWALIGRDLSHVSEGSRLLTRTRLQQVVENMAERISQAPIRCEPHALLPPLSPHAAELLASAVLAVLHSPAFFPSRLNRDDYCRELGELVQIVAFATLPAGFDGTKVEPRSRGLTPASRREALLAQAIRLFSERTYAQVRVEDVGASLEITATSVYNHFDNKSAILVTALERTVAHLMMKASDVLETATTAQEGLDGLLGEYCHFAMTHPALIDLMISETRTLPDRSRRLVSDSVQQYVGELASLHQTLRPELSAAAAHVQVEAVLMIPSAIGRFMDVRLLAGAEEAVTALCAHCLAAPSEEFRELVGAHWEMRWLTDSLRGAELESHR